MKEGSNEPIHELMAFARHLIPLSNNSDREFMANTDHITPTGWEPETTNEVHQARQPGPSTRYPTNMIENLKKCMQHLEEYMEKMNKAHKNFYDYCLSKEIPYIALIPFTPPHHHPDE